MGVRLATARNLLRLWVMLAVFAAPPTLVGAGRWDGIRRFSFSSPRYWSRWRRLRLLRSLPAGNARCTRAGRSPSGQGCTPRSSVWRRRRESSNLASTSSPTRYPRSFSVGRGRTASTVVVSLGTSRRRVPSRDRGLLAHELAHIRNRDVAVQTITVAIAAAIVELTRVGGYLQRGAALPARARRRGNRENRALAPARARRGRERRRSLRLAARSRRRACAPRAGERARLLSLPARRRSRSIRSTRSPTAIGWRGCSTPTRRSRKGCGGCASSIQTGRGSCCALREY